MLEDLFLTETPGEPSSTSIELPEDIELWPTEIQNILYTQVPALANVPGQLQFDTVEQDKKYAKGVYVVDAGTGAGNNEDSLVFPILVKNGELVPTDIYMYKGEFHPVDNDDISAILMSPELGTETMDPEDIPSTAYSDFSNRVSPPGAYGSGYVTSYNSKTGSINEKLISMIDNSSALRHRLMTNKTAQKRFLAILDNDETEKIASTVTNLPEKDAVIYALGDGLFSIKTAGFKHNSFYEQGIECDRKTLDNWIKTSKLNQKRIMEELKQNSMAFSWDTEKTASASAETNVKELGSYTVKDANSLKSEYADILGYVKTASGDKRYLAFLKDGGYSLQRDILGTPVDTEKTANMFNFDVPSVGKIITLQVGDDGEFAPPTKIASFTGFNTGEISGFTANGTSCRGRTSFIFLKEGAAKKPVKAGFIPDICFVDKSAEAWFVPMDYPVIGLKEERSLVKSAEDERQKQFIANNGKLASVPLRLWRTGEDIAMKIGTANPEIIEKTAAINLIHKYNTDGLPIFANLEKIASGSVLTMYLDKETPAVKSTYRRSIKPLTDRQRMATLKVAASLDDDETIDSVLGLNYVDTENMDDFKESLPDLKNAENILAKLLLSTRLGNSVVEEEDVSSVIGSLHEIVKALESRI